MLLLLCAFICFRLLTPAAAYQDMAGCPVMGAVPTATAAIASIQTPGAGGSLAGVAGCPFPGIWVCELSPPSRPRVGQRQVFLPLVQAPGAPAEVAAYIPAVDPSPGPMDVSLTPEAVLVMPTPDGVRREQAVPILMYHHVSDPQPGWDRLRRSLTVSETQFRGQLVYLRGRGYQTVHLAELVNHLTTGAPLPEKPIVITFDDGYRDNYEVALPALQEYGFVATFFLVTAPIDEGSPEFMTWEQVKAMHQAGMEFGSHSYTHPDLRGKSEDYLVWQLVGSKEAIEERIGEPVRFLAYPSGAYDEQVIAVAKSAGFWGAVAVDFGCRQALDRLFTLSRVRVTPEDTESSFERKLALCSEHP